MVDLVVLLLATIHEHMTGSRLPAMSNTGGAAHFSSSMAATISVLSLPEVQATVAQMSAFG